MWILGAIASISLLTLGCSPPSATGLDDVDPPCRDHDSPIECQAVLDTALADFSTIRGGYEYAVGPILCVEKHCSTWISAQPVASDDCQPIWNLEMSRSAGQPWSIEGLVHGHPIECEE